MPYPRVGFPPPFEWPHVGRQWPPYNVESDQAEGLIMWMPYGGGYPGSRRHVDMIGGLSFTEGGTPVWVFDAERGWPLLFDGANDYLEVDIPVVTAAPFSVSMWVWPESLVSWDCAFYIGDKDDANFDYWQALLNVGQGGKMTWVAKTATNSQSHTAIAMTQDSWNHVLAVEAAANNHAIYLHGGNKGTNVQASAPANVDRTSIGRRGDATPGQLWQGRIMDVRAYDVAKTDDQAYQIATNPWELWRPPRRLWVLAPTAGQQYFQSAAGVLTPAGAIIKRTGLPRAGTLTPAGAVVKMTATLRAGTLTPTGAITKRAGLSFAGALTTAGVLVGQAQKAIVGTLTTAGALARRAAKPLAGTLTTAGAIAKRAGKPLAGTLTTAGAIAKKTARSFAGTLTTAGAVAKKAILSFAGTLTPTGAVATIRIYLQGLAGTLTTAGALVRETRKSLTGTLTITGAVATVADIAVIAATALTLWTRNVALTLRDRAQDLTLWARGLGLTLKDRE